MCIRIVTKIDVTMRIARVKGRACPCHAKAKAKSYMHSRVYLYNSAYKGTPTAGVADA